jgi:hypothetical protein
MKMKRILCLMFLFVAMVLVAAPLLRLVGGPLNSPQIDLTRRSLLYSANSVFAAGPNMDSILGGTALAKVTVSFWYDSTTLGTDYGGFFGATDGSWDVGLFGYINNIELAFNMGSYTHAMYVAPGTGYHHYVAVFDNTGANLTKLYKDGSEVASLDSSSRPSITPVAAPFYLGYTQDGYLGPVGYFRNFALWDTALTAGNVTTLYNGGIAGNKALDVEPSHLKLFLPINQSDNVETANGILDASGNAKNFTGSGMTNGTNLVSAPVI